MIRPEVVHSHVEVAKRIVRRSSRAILSALPMTWQPCTSAGAQSSQGGLQEQGGFDQTVGPKVLLRLKIQQLCKARARPADPTFDRAKGRTTDAGRLLVGQSLRSDEQECLAL